ncbi:MAG TPA: endonuclease/exonuclease/phosphatase family protein [Candidatus Binataceae bacterium]|jgi:exodeoxyribonuclease-3|nr:endonuclease/exonuclease/phosphatase family protein [Candidatus Binataceae bacterium]
MRIISWNCGSGFHRKIEALLALAPDVAVVQECADLDSLARKAPGFAPTGALWTGDNPHRGLGVFSFGPYRLSRVGAADASITYAIAARVVGPSAFNLVALWSHYGKSPMTVAEPGPTVRALRSYASLLKRRPSIIAGDLNNHVRWDKPGKASNHANAMAEIAAFGLASAYHAFYGLAQGSERHPTLYWRDRTRTGPTFHIDYVFVPQIAIGLLRRVAVGSYAKWIATGLSDHAPLIVDLLPQFTAVRGNPIARGAVDTERLRKYPKNAPDHPDLRNRHRRPEVAHI